MWVLKHGFEVRSIVAALLAAGVECPELYAIDSEREATNEELLPRLSTVFSELGQPVPGTDRALIQFVKCFATIADEEGQDLAEFGFDTYRIWFDPYGHPPPSALEFVWDLYSIDSWPPEQTWEVEAAAIAREGLHRLFKLSVDELM